MSFFVVGRLFRKNGIDNLAFVLVLFTSAIYTSTEYKFRFLRYSVSLFEIHCLWPWKLWVFVGILIPLVIVIVFKHVQYAMQHGLLVSKLVELTLSVLFFLVPVVSNSNFHFHHWYAGWLVGMHCSFDTWWSRATMAWFWGMYIQGIHELQSQARQLDDASLRTSGSTRLAKLFWLHSLGTRTVLLLSCLPRSPYTELDCY